MASPLSDPFYPTPPLFPSRSKSTSLRDKPSESKLTLNAMLTASRAPSPPMTDNSRSLPSPQPWALLQLRSRSQTRLATRSTSPPPAAPLLKHHFTAPPTWRSKFEDFLPRSTGGRTLRRSNLKISEPIPIAAPIYGSGEAKRSSIDSTFSTASTASNISLASSTVEYGTAEAVRCTRPKRKPKVVQATSQSTLMRKTRNDSTSDRKLAEYFGVRPSDRATVARQRADSEGVRRTSAFHEDFTTSAQGSTSKGYAEGADDELSEGMVKWFRCDIYPADAPAFHSVEEEAKRLVVEGGGRVMGQWAYPGGFMFQIPRNLASLLPPSMPSATSTPTSKVLLSNLGPEGHLRVTEFQPHLDPMQHLLSLSPYTPGTPNSGTSTIKAAASPNPDKYEDEEMMSAMEYINSASAFPPSEAVEEIPLLRMSPAKPSNASATQPNKPRQSWQTSTSTSPETKGKLQLWLQKQQASSQVKRKREGQVYDLGQLARRTQAMLRKIEEENEEDAWVSAGGSVEGEDEDGDEDEARSGSEFSVATGMASVKFVAECGSLF